MAYSLMPMVETKYPLHQNAPVGIFLFFFLIQADDLPLRILTAKETENLGGMTRYRWICSSPMYQALRVKPFHLAISLKIRLNSVLMYSSFITAPGTSVSRPNGTGSSMCSDRADTADDCFSLESPPSREFDSSLTATP